MRLPLPLPLHPTFRSEPPMKPLPAITILTLLTVAIYLFLGPSEVAYMRWVNGGPDIPDQLPRDLVGLGLVVAAGVVAWVSRFGMKKGRNE